jgi:transcriptional regulator with XRE-family HTH domain
MVFGRGRDQQRPDHRAIEARVDEEMHGLVTQLTNEITFHMRERGITRADLAARMGVSPGRVSQILGGGENLTLRTLAALASALDARFDVELCSLKVDDTFTSREKADTEAVQNQHTRTRSQHQQNTSPRR